MLGIFLNLFCFSLQPWWMRRLVLRVTLTNQVQDAKESWTGHGEETLVSSCSIFVCFKLSIFLLWALTPLGYTLNLLCLFNKYYASFVGYFIWHSTWLFVHPFIILLFNIFNLSLICLLSNLLSIYHFYSFGFRFPCICSFILLIPFLTLFLSPPTSIIHCLMVICKVLILYPGALISLCINTGYLRFLLHTFVEQYQAENDQSARRI